MATRLPLFPLDVVLFPGTRIPLHIFEPRYQALLADVLAGDGHFGLVAPGPDGEPPARGAIGCIARVVGSHALADGRSYLEVIGEGRFVLRGLDEDLPTPYLVGRIEPFGDEEGTNELPGDLVGTLRDLGARCRAAMRALAETSDDTPWQDDVESLTFQIGAILPWSADEARRLLVLRSPAERAAVLLHLLPRLVPELEGRAAVHARAHTNGHGPHPGASGGVA